MWRIAALATPTERERTQWYFQRYVAHLPAAGELVMFDRSWYNRAGVERVMGFCTEEEYQEFMRSCPEFERMLVRSGIILIKYWFSVSDAEQERRFQARVNDPMRRWKLSPMDLKSREKWVEYSRAKDDMFAPHRHQAGAVVRRRRRRQAPRAAELHLAPAVDDPLRGRHPAAARAAQAPGRRALRAPADHRPDVRPRGVLTAAVRTPSLVSDLTARSVPDLTYQRPPHPAELSAPGNSQLSQTRVSHRQLRTAGGYRTMIRSTFKAVAVAGIAVASVGTATASAADTGNAIEAGIAAYKAAYPKLSDAQARAAAAGADARRAVYDAAAADAATFGGAWFDPTTGIVHLAATTDAAVKRADAIGKQYAVAVEPRTRSSARPPQLEADAAQLRAGKDELGQAAAGNVGVDVHDQRGRRRGAGRSQGRAGVARPPLVARSSSRRPRRRPSSTPAAPSRAACDWTIRAGAIMWRGTTSPRTRRGARSASPAATPATRASC